MTAASLSLSLFGTFRAAVDGFPVTSFPTDKVRALLAYLAVESGRPHPRTRLAALLWPDMPDEIALRNLRKTLHRLHAALAPSLGTATDAVIAATRQAIQIDPAACAVDVAAFQGALDAAANHPHRHLRLCPPCLERLMQAAALYQGELLAGFGLPDAEPFEEWLLLTRERLLHQVLQGLYDLAAALTEREEYEQAYAYAMRQVELDPGREEAHRQVLRVLALDGKRGEALAYFARCRQMLLDSLGVEPAAETMALVNQLQRDETPGAAVPAGPHHLPVQLTPFVGRTTELLQIAEHLRDPACRVVTLVGQGGMGKTRLAVRAADQQAGRERFADGIFFIPLAEMHSCELLPTTLAAALGLDLDQHADPRAQLLHYLAARECLLVLDNFEHLLDARDLLLAILQSAPRVRLLVTARLPLDLRAEQRLPLEGLDYPGQGQTASPVPAAAIAGSSSVQLFAQAALRAQPGFVLSAANEQDVLHICRLVDGMPLALELAAPWVRVMECSAIAAALERNISLLATRARDVPDRHRSIEAVITQSWRLLTVDEQTILAQLAVFRGPFDLQAAERVVGATVLDMAELLDKGLIQRASGGLYQLHGLLRQFVGGAPATMAGLDLLAAKERHSDYYLDLVASHERALYSRNARQAVAALRQQFGNIRKAWDWAAEHAREDALARCLEAVVRFWELASAFEEAESRLAQAAAMLEARPATAASPDASPRRLLSRVLVWRAHFLEIRNRVDDAIRAVETALAPAERSGDLEGEALARTVLGQLMPYRGEFGGAIMHLEEACSYFQSHDMARQLARALRLLGVAQWRSGAYAGAVERLNHARTIQESLGDQWELARVCSALAGVSFEQGDLETARLQAHEALRIYEASNDRWGTAGMRGNLALVYRRLGRFDLALQHNGHDLETSRDMGDQHAVAIVLGNRGMIYLEGGDLDQAMACLEEAWHIEESSGNSWDAARHQALLAHAHQLRGERARALAHLGRALPVLRAHGARYYSVLPLLHAAEIRLDLGHLEQAATLAQEATALAEELGLRDETLRGHALAARIVGAGGARGRAAGQLQALRPLDGRRERRWPGDLS